jgi:Fic family protein
LHAFSASADDAIQTIDQLTALHDKSVSSLHDLSSRQKTNVLKLFTYLETNPIIDIQKTANALELSYNTVSKAVSILVDKGILIRSEKLGKAKIYSYAAYLDILRKDT